MAISEPKNQYAPANPTTTKDSPEAIADSTFERINVRSPATTYIDADAFQKRVLSHEGSLLLDKRNLIKAEYEKRYADAVAPIETRLKEIYRQLIELEPKPGCYGSDDCCELPECEGCKVGNSCMKVWKTRQGSN
ncbi:MAG: hypothetical protein BWY93_02111 [Euryarchaeota archaeon ADurb.BinA087]|nr:MAG: hypothetical protein BWY93_02111 [Euryarchaeota archaeon ADurb.BinA087]